ncbi:hypothetical protein SAMN05892883_1668 [Jatrophihabitans sp. GAS493]|uniref:FitA-like ribbon-helix-helix domain-containing protein n=1 Tax=Jatrophihabitans sp. GAS493 TaxID=1907575 RepID=UPI000BBFCF75|nr:hypothetical protein [Jatrophihabitans sp. GAS493]SOD72259.1 hypothetical protein SAMN05892883_1668 [Jatrophihabitans sp. GAS493]
MANMLVRDVSPGVHAQLQARAQQRGQSLQQFLLTELQRIAEQPSMNEVLERIAARRGGRVGFAQAVDDVAAERRRS